jgi:hypothetical protein
MFYAMFRTGLCEFADGLYQSIFSTLTSDGKENEKKKTIDKMLCSGLP